MQLPNGVRVLIATSCAIVGVWAGIVACDVAVATSPLSPDGGTKASSGGTAGNVEVQILAFNDFHGNLRPPGPSNAVVLADPTDPAVTAAGSPVATDAGVQIYAGGAAYFASHVKALRASNPNTLLVSAGDMTGASPLISSLYDDEPTIRILSKIGVDYSSVGNHEFDKGPAELIRKQVGGCGVDLTDAGGSCFADPTFPGATWTYLGANVDVVDAAAGGLTDASLDKGGSATTLFPPYEVKTVGGAKIAFIGMTLEGTATIVSPAGTAGLTFVDETATVNTLVPVLKSQGVDAIIVLIHQGGFQSGTYNDCANFNPLSVATGQHDIAYIADNLDPAVDAIHSAHTHIAYNCTRANGRILTSAASYGRIITQLSLTIDTTKHLVTKKSAKNVVVTRDVTPDPDIQTMIDKYETLSAPIADRPVGYISADITLQTGANGESALGDLIADSYAQATAADVAFVNIGGVRDSLLYKEYYQEGDGTVTFEKAESVLPFGDKIVTLDCTGQDIINALQQNVFVQPGGGTKLLQQSSSLTYSWSASKADAAGQTAADPSTMMINGEVISPTQHYVVGTVDFVGSGGDGYAAFEACPVTATIGTDLDIFTTTLGQSTPTNPIGPPTTTRVTALP